MAVVGKLVDGLFGGGDDVPRADPAVAAAQQAQQQRAEADKTKAISAQLGDETLRRNSSLFGLRSLLGTGGLGRSLLGGS